MQRCLDAPGTYDSGGWLTVGLCGHQPDIGEMYISTGSLYLVRSALCCVLRALRAATYTTRVLRRRLRCFYPSACPLQRDSGQTLRRIGRQSAFGPQVLGLDLTTHWTTTACNVIAT
jgi:hypothetical protein